MSEPAQKCENCGIFKQNYTLKVFVAFKTANSCCFTLRGNLNFPDFLQKKFYNINSRDHYAYFLRKSVTVQLGSS